jgi:hypothetical protein
MSRVLVLWVALVASSLAQATQVSLRQGESGPLGSRTLHVLRVDDQRCGPTENCLADVLAQVRVQNGAKSSTVVVSLFPRAPQPWTGMGVSHLTRDAVTLTTQPPGSSKPAEQVTLQRGQTGRLGGRRVTVQGWETVRCLPQVLCVRPEWSYVYVDVESGPTRTGLALEYPRVPVWPGLALIRATAEQNPTLTFTDTRP